MDDFSSQELYGTAALIFAGVAVWDACLGNTFQAAVTALAAIVCLGAAYFTVGD